MSSAAKFVRRAAARMLSVRHVSWSRVDWHVLLVALSLLAVGLVFVRAIASADQAFERQPTEFGSHLKKVVIALPALAIGLLLKPRWLRNNAWKVYGATLVLLALLPVFGRERNNAKRWLDLGPIGFDLQPSELAKLGLILALARVLYTCRLASWSEWRKPVLVALVPMALVALQPDLGTAMTMVPVTVGMFYLAGARGRRIAGIVAGVVLAFVLAYQFELIRDYQLQRIETWFVSLSPASLIEAKTGPAYHAYQARVAIGNGGLFGRGLGQGVANEAASVPERDCDSLFAVIAEEAGLYGTAGLLVLYAFFIVLLLLGASAIRERYSRLVVGGIGLYFASHFFVNVGVNLGLIPMTGLTLPLLSTGGSSLLASFAALGLALGLAAQREPTLDQDAFRD
jgi:rod shape determining protein RodA